MSLNFSHLGQTKQLNESCTNPVVVRLNAALGSPGSRKGYSSFCPASSVLKPLKIPLGTLHASSIHGRQLSRKRNLQIRVTGFIALILTIAVIVQYLSLSSTNSKKPLLVTTGFSSILKSTAVHPSTRSVQDLQSPLGKAFTLARPVPFYQLAGSEGGINETLIQKQPTDGTGLIGIPSRKIDRNQRMAVELQGN